LYIFVAEERKKFRLELIYDTVLVTASLSICCLCIVGSSIVAREGGNYAPKF